MAANSQLKLFCTAAVMFMSLRSAELFRATEYATDANQTQPREIRVKRSADWNLPTYLKRYHVENQQPDSLQDMFTTLHKKDLSINFRPLCETSVKHIHLQDDTYEYQPARYTEIHCRAYSARTTSSGDMISSNQRCVYPGFSCMPRSQTMYFLRRDFNTECWESFTKEVPSGCDCMWPESRFGDISRHY